MESFSAVIVKQPVGYIAHLRFVDPTKDVDIGHLYKVVLYQVIDSYINKIMGGLYGRGN